MMKGFNVNIALCESYDNTTMSVTKFFNEVRAIDNKAKICVFSMLNYVGCEEADLGLDYFVKCIKPEDERYQDTKIPLFSIEAKKKEENQTEEYNVFESIFAQPKEISFPTKGIYEIQVYEIGESVRLIEKAVERYKKYQESKINPISAYRFMVV